MLGRGKNIHTHVVNCKVKHDLVSQGIRDIDLVLPTIFGTKRAQIVRYFQPWETKSLMCIAWRLLSNNTLGLLYRQRLAKPTSRLGHGFLIIPHENSGIWLFTHAQNSTALWLNRHWINGWEPSRLYGIPCDVIDQVALVFFTHIHISL